MKRSPQPVTYIVNPEIEAYVESLSATEDEVLTEMERYALENDFPIIGPQIGRFLYQLTLISGAKRVMELGSGFGYSAYWFAKALGGSGRVTFTDSSPHNAGLAEGFLKRAGVGGIVDIKVGDALDILDRSGGDFDIIFNDIDKEYYPAVVGRAYAKLRKGGILITDNLLWHGRVVSDDGSPSTAGVLEFTKRLFSEAGFYSTVIPVRDGISLSVKL